MHHLNSTAGNVCWMHSQLQFKLKPIYDNTHWEPRSRAESMDSASDDGHMKLLIMHRNYINSPPLSVIDMHSRWKINPSARRRFSISNLRLSVDPSIGPPHSSCSSWHFYPMPVTPCRERDLRQQPRNRNTRVPVNRPNTLCATPPPSCPRPQLQHHTSECHLSQAVATADVYRIRNSTNLTV